jgi:hypothetical protein
MSDPLGLIIMCGLLLGLMMFTSYINYLKFQRKWKLITDVQLIIQKTLKEMIENE